MSGTISAANCTTGARRGRQLWRVTHKWHLMLKAKDRFVECFLIIGEYTVYPKKLAHGFCFAVLCCGYKLTDFPISIRLTSLALWQSNDCPSAGKATLMNMDKYFMWIHYEWLHNHNKAKHNKTVCIFLGIYCTVQSNRGITSSLFYVLFHYLADVFITRSRMIYQCSLGWWTLTGVIVWLYHRRWCYKSIWLNKSL